MHGITRASTGNTVADTQPPGIVTGGDDRSGGAVTERDGNIEPAAHGRVRGRQPFVAELVPDLAHEIRTLQRLADQGLPGKREHAALGSGADDRGRRLYQHPARVESGVGKLFDVDSTGACVLNYLLHDELTIYRYPF